MVPGEIDCGTCTGELLIEGVTMHTAAWCVIDSLEPLWVPAGRRGSNVVLPGASGTRPYAPRVAEARVNLAFLISGYVDEFGIAAADPAEQLKEHLEFLQATVFELPGTMSGTRSAELWLPGSYTHILTADVQVVLSPGNMPGYIKKATIGMTIPAGRFS